MNNNTTTKVFVYGTLMTGHSNHHLLQGLVGTPAVTVDSHYKMQNHGGFPSINKEGNTQVIGEVFEVNQRQLARLDDLENHPNWYKREEVQVTLHSSQLFCQRSCETLEVVTAWVYIMSSERRWDTDRPVIEDSDWNAYIEQQRNLTNR